MISEFLSSSGELTSTACAEVEKRMPVTSQAGEVTPWSSTTAAAREAQGHGGMTHDGEREARPFCGQVWHRVESIFRKEDQAQHGTACEHRESLAAGRREVKLLAKVHEARSEQRILSLSPRPRRAWVPGCARVTQARNPEDLVALAHKPLAGSKSHPILSCFFKASCSQRVSASLC